MDILEYLKADHQKVAKLLKQLEDTTERAEQTRAEVFGQIKQALDIHAKFEETEFYPQLKEHDKTEDLTREAYEEHHLVKTLLAELESMDVTDPQWVAKVTVLRELIEHHVEEEEKELFPKAKKVYSAEELIALGERYAKEVSKK